MFTHWELTWYPHRGPGNGRPSLWVFTLWRETEGRGWPRIPKCRDLFPSPSHGYELTFHNYKGRDGGIDCAALQWQNIVGDIWWIQTIRPSSKRCTCFFSSLSKAKMEGKWEIHLQLSHEYTLFFVLHLLIHLQTGTKTDFWHFFVPIVTSTIVVMTALLSPSLFFFFFNRYWNIALDIIL